MAKADGGVAVNLSSWEMLPPELRAVAIGGGGALVVALGIIAFLFFPSSSSPRKPPAAAPAGCGGRGAAPTRKQNRNLAGTAGNPTLDVASARYPTSSWRPTAAIRRRKTP